jgi:hypothetical protein
MALYCRVCVVMNRKQYLFLCYYNPVTPDLLCSNIFAEHLLRMNLLVSSCLRTDVLVLNQTSTVPSVFSVLVKASLICVVMLEELSHFVMK